MFCEHRYTKLALRQVVAARSSERHRRRALNRRGKAPRHHRLSISYILQKSFPALTIFKGQIALVQAGEQKLAQRETSELQEAHPALSEVPSVSRQSGGAYTFRLREFMLRLGTAFL